MAKLKLKSVKKTRPKKSTVKSTAKLKSKQKKGGKNPHIAKLEKKLMGISAHIKKCKEDLQSVIRLKQLQNQIRGK